MKLKLIALFTFDLNSNFLKFIAYLLLPFSLGSISYASESEIRLKSCMTVRTLHESLSDESKGLHDYAKYRRFLRMFKLNNDSASNDVLVSLIDQDYSDSLRVSFGTIELKNYPIILGDNPAVSCGLPLTIDWEPDEGSELNVDIDEYEANRPRRRNARDLVLSSVARDLLIVQSGHHRSEKNEAYLELKLAKLNREKTIKCLHNYKLQEHLEIVCHGIKHIFTRGKAVQEQKKLADAMQIDRDRLVEREVIARKESEALEKLLKGIREGSFGKNDPCEFLPYEADNSECDDLDI